MDVKKLRLSLVNNRWILPFCVVITIISRLFSEGFVYDIPNIVSLLLQVATAIYLLQISHAYSIIRERSILPTIFFLIFAGTGPKIGLNGSIVCLAVLFCLMQAFRSYQVEKSQPYAFTIAIFLSVASCYAWGPSILFLVYFIISFYQFKSLNVRSFFAFLMGILIVCIFIFSWSVAMDDMDFVFKSIPSIQFSTDTLQIIWNAFVWDDYLSLIFMFILFVISIFHFFLNIYREKIKIRALISSLIFLTAFCLAGIIFVSGGKTTFLFIIYIPASILVSHYFTLSKNTVSAWLLIFTLIFYLGIYCSNIIT